MDNDAIDKFFKKVFSNYTEIIILKDEIKNIKNKNKQLYIGKKYLDNVKMYNELMRECISHDINNSIEMQNKFEEMLIVFSDLKKEINEETN